MSIFKIEAAQEKCSLLSSTSKLQMHKGSVSGKPCLNLCSFKWLKRRHNLVRYLKPSGSLTLNIDLLLGLIKDGSLFLKTAIEFEFCISGASCNHSDREFGKKEYLKQSVFFGFTDSTKLSTPSPATKTFKSKHTVKTFT